MDTEKIKSEIEGKRAELKQLQEGVKRHTCDGLSYSMPEDVEMMDRIETLEDEIAALEKDLGAPASG